MSPWIGEPHPFEAGDVPGRCTCDELEHHPSHWLSVADYFHHKLDSPLEPKPPEPIPVYSPHHPEFHIMTGCGVECKRAIDAAHELISCSVEAGFVVLPLSRTSLIEHTKAIVEVYVHG